MLNNTAIVLRIEEIRKKHQLTAASFATKIGVQRSAISHILSGRNKPSLDFLMKIHYAFDKVNLEWLILGKSSPLTQDLENLHNPRLSQATEVLNEIIPESKIVNPNPLQRVEAPIEIIYLYADGEFERFTPKN
jgi:transcriptional regulator with XRE-family HTH domain